MITSSDIEYQNAKLIKKGIEKIDPDFKKLAEWISNKYGVTVINICHGLMTNQNRIRVAIAVEFRDEYLKFKEDNKRCSNYNEKIQSEIAEKYIELSAKILKLESENKILGLYNRKRKVNPKDIFVSTSAFEPIAREEANTKIPESRISNLISSFGLPEIWTISRCFDSTTLFVFNKEQKSYLEDSNKLKKIEDEYFNLLKEYDEFDYLKRKQFKIQLDTKQNFDENYESNWYYYYK